MNIVKGQRLYLTKYALTKGVEIVVADADSDNHRVRLEGFYTGYQLGRDVHVTLEAARVIADKKRLAKLAALQRQVAKLQKLSFAEEAE